MHIHPLARHAHLMHEGHGHDGKSLVHLPQIDIIDRPAQLIQQLACRRDGRCRK